MGKVGVIHEGEVLYMTKSDLRLPFKRFLSSGYLLVQTKDRKHWGYGKYFEDSNKWICNFVGMEETEESIENIEWKEFERF
jgi:hypothetical protein